MVLTTHVVAYESPEYYALLAKGWKHAGEHSVGKDGTRWVRMER